MHGTRIPHTTRPSAYAAHRASAAAGATLAAYDAAEALAADGVDLRHPAAAALVAARARVGVALAGEALAVMGDVGAI
jgi:hypothetical protein